MTFSAIRISFALAMVAIATQAAPLGDLSSDSGCVGSACDQSVDSGSVSLGSTTSIVPVTEVTPVTRVQPYVQAFAPIVESECGYGSDCYGQSGLGGYGGDYGGYGSDYSSIGNYGASGLGGYGGGYGSYGAGSAGYAGDSGIGSRIGSGLYKRQDMGAPMGQDSMAQSSEGAMTQPASDCRAGEEGCITSVPEQSVDMGSQVNMIPSTNVFPATSYQNHVQALDSDIQAADAQSNVLPEESVNLGSNILIQPATHVTPQTLYQPSVSQLTTTVDAAAQEDQSLPQSSVQLGSQVNITPTVSVQPLTTFQNTIQSLPFIIDVAPCADTFGQGSLDMGRQGFAGGLDARFGGASSMIGSSAATECA